jgi:hypothetical protein
MDADYFNALMDLGFTLMVEAFIVAMLTLAWIRRR